MESRTDPGNVGTWGSDAISAVSRCCKRCAGDGTGSVVGDIDLSVRVRERRARVGLKSDCSCFATTGAFRHHPQA